MQTVSMTRLSQRVLSRARRNAVRASRWASRASRWASRASRWALGGWCLFLLLSHTASAQPPSQSEETPDLTPRAVTLATRDGVTLRAWYAPSDQGKEAVTVLIVHEWKGQGMPYAKLVTALQEAGCAVLVPEYRGHGGSREYTDRRGRTREFNLETMGRQDIQAILAADLEVAKGFLKKENNEGNLNLNALAVIGVREGSVLAAHWALRDWQFPSVGSVKQGQDVKALVLVSPTTHLKGLAIQGPLRDPMLLRLPIMLVVGSESEEAEQVLQLAKQIHGRKKRAGRGDAQGFEMKTVSTSLSGLALIDEADSVIPAIVDFIDQHVKTGDQLNPWIWRR